ncbi:MAG TPA: BREX-6 system BrxE protein [Myxococcales bacterium]|nr:BREX-6 system BrxE protein [Myxococcales bacterium]
MSPTPTSTLDAILALQLTVAWAGEARCEPARLGWWQTDLIDEAGGGDLLARLLPRSHAWASLEAVREAARRADESSRRKLADPDAVRTLYFFGFDLDEALAERLAQLKREGRKPAEALSFPISLDEPFSADRIADALRVSTTPAFEIVPGGRQLKAALPSAIDHAARNLAAALLPFSEGYPMPFYRAKP